MVVTAPATFRPGLSFAPKSHLNSTGGKPPAPEPDPGTASSPGHPAGDGRAAAGGVRPFYLQISLKKR